jgi:glycerol-3-phosphate acyltransferase PlsX
LPISDHRSVITDAPTVESSRSIAVDVMGSDLGPDEVVAGVALALRRKYASTGLVLVGEPGLLGTLLQTHKLTGHPEISMHPASEVIGMQEKPIESLKRKKDASLVQAIEQIKSGRCAAAVSCGNTGSLMACSTIRLRPIEGVFKPALATVWPGKDRHFVLLDAGANPQCKPEHLAQYAVLGSLYAEDALRIQRPRVGLLSIGTEESKGTELTAQTHELLKRIDDQINYIGLIEGFQLFRDEVDVVVTDGFTGNVVLKGCESLYKMLKSIIKEEIRRNPLRMLAAALFIPVMRAIRNRLDPDRYAGAPMLGLRGLVIKAHGSANRVEIANAIRIAARLVDCSYRAQSEAAIARANARIRPAGNGSAGNAS